MKESMRVAALGSFAALGATLGIFVAVKMNDSSSVVPTPDTVEITTQIPWDGPTDTRVDGLAPPPPLAESAVSSATELAEAELNSPAQDAGGWQPDSQWESRDDATSASTAHYVADDADVNSSYQTAAEPSTSPEPAADSFESEDYGSDVSSVPPPTWTETTGANEETEPECGSECGKTLSSPTPVDSSSTNKHSPEKFDVAASSAPAVVVRNARTAEPIASIRLGGEVCEDVEVRVVQVAAPQTVQQVNHQTSDASESTDIAPATHTAVAESDDRPVRIPPVSAQEVTQGPDNDVVPQNEERPSKVTRKAVPMATATSVARPEAAARQPARQNTAEEVIVAASGSVLDEAAALIEVGQNEVAIDLLRAAASSHGSQALYHELIGEAFLRMGQFDVASRALSTSLSIDKQSARANYLMGLTLMNMRQKNRSEHYLLQAHDLDARYPLNPLAP